MYCLYLPVCSSGNRQSLAISHSSCFSKAHHSLPSVPSDVIHATIGYPISVPCGGYGPEDIKASLYTLVNDSQTEQRHLWQIASSNQSRAEADGYHHVRTNFRIDAFEAGDDATLVCDVQTQHKTMRRVFKMVGTGERITALVLILLALASEFLLAE